MAGSCKKEDWTFASGLVAAREVRMLPLGFFQQLLAEPRLEGLLRRLSPTPLGERIRAVEDMRRADRHAADAYRAAIDEMRGFCPSPDILDMLDLPRLLRSFKDFVKRRVLGLAAGEAAPAPDDDETWQRVWDDNWTGLPQYFARAASQARSVLDAAGEQPELLDAAVDAACLSALTEEAGHCGDPFVAGYFRRYDTAKGVEMLWRARALGAGDTLRDLLCRGRHERALFSALVRTEDADWPPLLSAAMDGLRADRFAEAEGPGRIRGFVSAADEWLMDYARGARSVPFGSARVFAYLVGMDAELRNLSVVVAGRAGGIAGELLASRLRACYV